MRELLFVMNSKTEPLPTPLTSPIVVMFDEFKEPIHDDLGRELTAVPSSENSEDLYSVLQYSHRCKCNGAPQFLQFVKITLPESPVPFASHRKILS